MPRSGHKILLLLLLQKTVLLQLVQRQFRLVLRCGEELDRVQAQHLVFLAEDVGEAALGQAAMQWHLPALKAADHARA